MGALLLPGCGGGEADAGDRPVPALRGSALVAGSTLDGWGLLVLPREGGPAELRALDDPSRRLWTGRASLPPSVEAHPLEGGTAVLRAADGTVYRYDPSTDAVAEVGEVAEGAAWSGFDGAGAWTDPARTSVLVVTTSDAWRASLPARPLWASPVGEGAAVTIVGEPEAGRLLLLEREQGQVGTSPETGADGPAVAEVRPPASVTAWGRRIAAVDADGRRLVVLSVPELAPVSAMEVDEPITALAPSPSSHAFYVALGAGPARILSVSRLRDRTRRLARLEGSVGRIRTSVLGGYLLVETDGRTVLIPPEGEEPVLVPGRWRPDLPLGLPDGSVLVRVDRGVGLWVRGDPERGEPRPVEGAPDGWWLAVPWRPPAPERVAAAERPPEGEAVAGTAEEASDREEAVSDRGDAEVSEEAGDAAAPEPAAEAASEPAGEAFMDPGFYAIVSSSQQADAITALARRLDEAGFRSRVQRHRDEAGELWHRAMVGPYESRTQAEAAARQLRRERGLQAWIAEVGPDVRPDDGPS